LVPPRAIEVTPWHYGGFAALELEPIERDFPCGAMEASVGDLPQPPGNGDIHRILVRVQTGLLQATGKRRPDPRLYIRMKRSTLPLVLAR
jgi:hypothetical protein